MGAHLYGLANPVHSLPTSIGILKLADNIQYCVSSFRDHAISFYTRSMCVCVGGGGVDVCVCVWVDVCVCVCVCVCVGGWVGG